MTKSEDEPTIDVKLFVDKEKKKVLFAESDKDFVDVLFSWLTLPLGTIVRLLSKQSQVGLITSTGVLRISARTISKARPARRCFLHRSTPPPISAANSRSTSMTPSSQGRSVFAETKAAEGPLMIMLLARFLAQSANAAKPWNTLGIGRRIMVTLPLMEEALTLFLVFLLPAASSLLSPMISWLRQLRRLS